MSTTTLTDRYVWTVTRALPPEAGPDVARELRSSIEETIEGRVAAGEDPGAAERETVLGLGDPDVLAREYGGRPNHLVGPDVFPAWVRLVKVLLAVVVPIAVAGDLAANALASDKGFGELVGGAAVVALHTGVHLVFWTTLVFALVERRGGREEREQIAPAWDPDTLTRAKDEWRVGLGELVLELVTDAVLILAWSGSSAAWVSTVSRSSTRPSPGGGRPSSSRRSSSTSRSRWPCGRAGRGAPASRWVPWRQQCSRESCSSGCCSATCSSPMCRRPSRTPSGGRPTGPCRSRQLPSVSS